MSIQSLYPLYHAVVVKSEIDLVDRLRQQVHLVYVATLWHLSFDYKTW